MLPINEITKGTSKEFKAALLILGGVWVVTTIIHASAQYRLAKANLELTNRKLGKTT
jgi:hypothetical protein